MFLRGSDSPALGEDVLRQALAALGYTSVEHFQRKMMGRRPSGKLDEATYREQLARIGRETDEVRAQLDQGAASERGAGPSADGYRFANRYWVFVQDGETLTAVNVETGLTDLDYSEVNSGLTAGDTVVLLPSSGLVQSQQRLQQRMRQFTGIPGMSGNSNDNNRQRSNSQRGRPN